MSEDAQNVKQVWAEKFLATILCVHRLLKKPEIFVNPDSEGNTPMRIAAFDCYNEALIARVIADCIVKQNKHPDEVCCKMHFFILICKSILYPSY